MPKGISVEAWQKSEILEQVFRKNLKIWSSCLEVLLANLSDFTSE
jgi:hypothetical protein